jgi:hypothetical protein
VARDELVDESIAKQVGISRSQLWRWKQHPEFRSRVEAVANKLGDISRRFTIAKFNARLKALDDRWHGLQAIVEARAADPAMQEAPGGDTGLLVRRRRMLGTGKNAVEVVEFVVDTRLLRELRALEKQAVIETGQWVDKVAPTDPSGGEEWQPSGFTEEEIKTILSGLAVRLGLNPTDLQTETGT